MATVSWIYFIRQGEDGPVKIGRATSPLHRLAQLQVGSPITLHLLGAVHVGASEAPRVERSAHETFAEWRISGEWFLPSRAVVGTGESYGPATCDTCQGVVTSAPALPDIGPCFICAWGQTE